MTAVLPDPESTSFTDAQRAVDEGYSHLLRRQWHQARDAFQRALADDERNPAAWEGLSEAVLSLDDADASRAAAERAFQEYLDRDDARSAARLATTLAMHHETYRGESAIASGWFERARAGSSKGFFVRRNMAGVRGEVAKASATSTRRFALTKPAASAASSRC